MLTMDYKIPRVICDGWRVEFDEDGVESGDGDI